jgi:hypothetical protein
LVVLAGEVFVVVVALAFADGVVGEDDGAGASVEDAGVVGVPG